MLYMDSFYPHYLPGLWHLLFVSMNNCTNWQNFIERVDYNVIVLVWEHSVSNHFGVYTLECTVRLKFYFSSL